MSMGIVVCSRCDREVHQDGPKITVEAHGYKQQVSTWQHCEDRTAMCKNATPDYARERKIIGVMCGMDGAASERKFYKPQMEERW